MKRLKFKQLVASLLLGAMLVGETSAFAAKDYPYDPPAPQFKDQVTATTQAANKPDTYSEKNNPNRGRITNVKVGWFNMYYGLGQDSSYLHVSWKAKKAKSLKKYEVQIGHGKSFGFSEYLTTKKNSVTLSSSCSYVFKPMLRPEKYNQYSIRVRALYKKGKPGKWSKVVRIRPTLDNQMSADAINKLSK